jgi:hypothetical protein
VVVVEQGFPAQAGMVLEPQALLAQITGLRAVLQRSA